MAKFIIIAGVSGSGKDTILNELIKSEHIVFVPSYTTRAMRPGEINGNRYNFVSIEEFNNSIKKGEFLEYAQVHHGGYYGTKINEIKNILDQNKNPIKQIDMIGLKKIKSEGKIDGKFISIFFDIPDDLIIKRITSRAPISEQELKERLKSAQIEREDAKKICNYIVNTGDSIEKNIENVKTVLEKELNN